MTKPVWDEHRTVVTWSAAVAVNGEKGPKKVDYEINFSTAIMSANGESRAFSREEAEKFREIFKLRARIDALTDTYAAESSAWWVTGHGVKVKPGDPHPEDTQKAPSKDSIRTLRASLTR